MAMQAYFSDLLSSHGVSANNILIVCDNSLLPARTENNEKDHEKMSLSAISKQFGGKQDSTMIPGRWSSIAASYSSDSCLTVPTRRGSASSRIRSDTTLSVPTASSSKTRKNRKESRAGDTSPKRQNSHWVVQKDKNESTSQNVNDYYSRKKGSLLISSSHTETTSSKISRQGRTRARSFETSSSDCALSIPRRNVSPARSSAMCSNALWEEPDRKLHYDHNSMEVPSRIVTSPRKKFTRDGAPALKSLFNALGSLAPQVEQKPNVVVPSKGPNMENSPTTPGKQLHDQLTKIPVNFK